MKHEWNYCSLGGVVRVNITSGEDIAHLGELDQKLWTVLSCPASGLDIDPKTAAALDTDADGKIRVPEIVAAAEWLTKVVKDKDSILTGADEIKIDNINADDEEGAKLQASARQILANLGLEKDSIGAADTADSVAIFKGSAFNGDGIITPASAGADESLASLIATIAEKEGAVTDRNGEAGIGADQIEKFYADCAGWSAWQAAPKADPAILPYDDTEAAMQAADAVADKIADYFMRCKLIGFDPDAAAAVDVPVDKLGAISDANLATQSGEIAKYPIARPRAGAVLPFDGINPAWQPAFDALKAAVLDKDFAGKDGMSEAEWNATLAKFAPYRAWKAAKTGEAVEALGAEAVDAAIKADRKAELFSLVEQDKALEAEAAGIDAVGKLTVLFRDFARVLRNYVIFSDFYGRESGCKALFEAGSLYIDQRCCNLCIKVEDMGQHADMAGLSGMFLIYCSCTSKTKAQTMNIVAVMTSGSIKNLRPGKHGVFYSLDGTDWDATVTKVVDNPVSVAQAFWGPYRKLGKFISDKIDKSAADKDTESFAKLQSATAEPGAPKQPFDISKFAGIFAAVGLAVGALGAGLGLIISAIKGLAWWKYIVIIAAIMLVISGPACFIAWRKLRKRNLGPVLNANGWAVNSVVLVNILFGRTLTTLAKYPKLNLSDPYAKKTPVWRKILYWIIALAIVAFGALYFTDNLGFMGIQRHKEADQEPVEAVAEEPAGTESAAELPAEEVQAAE